MGDNPPLFNRRSLLELLFSRDLLDFIHQKPGPFPIPVVEQMHDDQDDVGSDRQSIHQDGETKNEADYCSTPVKDSISIPKAPSMISLQMVMTDPEWMTAC